MRDGLYASIYSNVPKQAQTSSTELLIVSQVDQKVDL